MRLKAVFKGKNYFEGDTIQVHGNNVVIKHITARGLLYERAVPEYGYVTVRGDDGSRNDYYKDWDTLEFFACGTIVEEN